MEQHELRALEDKCIQECAPMCQAACPIHVDARGIAREMAKGDSAAALALLRKTLPFPGIISRICDSPCQRACKRNEIGDTIAINALERACVNYGGEPTDKPRVLPKKSKRVAIVGGGISGLTVAYDLGRKGYGVVIFEASDKLGGNLWQISRDELPAEIIRADIANVTNLGVEVRYNSLVNRLGLNGSSPKLAALRNEFDAIYLAFGAHTDDSFEVERDANGKIKVDPVTFATSMDGVFAGGGVLWSVDLRSSIQSISEGRRAGISLDRYLQRVSLTASRVNEGAYTTRLFTNTQGIASSSMIEMDDPVDGYERDEAIAEAQRCIQCECMECVKDCEYLRAYERYPRKYIREIYNNLAIVKGTRYANQFINSCSLCGQCAAVCPEHLDMGEVNQNARREMVKQNRMPVSAHDFALRDMEFSNSDKFAIARHQPGTTTSEYIFFPGCQLAASSPANVERVYADLRARLNANVGLMLGCCGAPAEWAGRDDLFQASLAQWNEQHAALGKPKVVLACSSCYRTFKKYLPDVEIISLWNLFEAWQLPNVQPNARTIAIHDSCSTRHESQMQDSVRNIVNRLGYKIEELALSRDKTACCSYGGVMWLANRDLAEKVVQRRIAESEFAYVTYCAMCRDFFAARGKPTRHLLDLIYGDDNWTTQRGPDFSQRHENRARLKRKMLKEIWSEPLDDPAEYESIQLKISDAMRERLDHRLILVEDIQRVIAHAEKTGRKFMNRDTGHWLASLKPNAVTYWVEYSQQGTAFEIHNAYSHRMYVEEQKQ